MARESEPRFVADGYDRAVKAATPSIRVEVEREYASRLSSAGWFKRMLLYFEIRGEIKRRAKRAAPPDALYFSA